MKIRKHTAERLFPFTAATSAEWKHPAGFSNWRLMELQDKSPGKKTLPSTEMEQGKHTWSEGGQSALSENP